MLYETLNNCTLCPHECGVNRLNGKRGFCRLGGDIYISHAGLHYGEEPPIVGERGSGTVFFSSCNMRCLYCQNYQISQPTDATRMKVLSREELVAEMLTLQRKGAHNINLVSPTHQIGQIAPALMDAKAQGLSIPVVYNTNGYDKVETLQALRGLIDIYLPDMKYSADEEALRYSGIKHYVSTNRSAVAEMARQAGPLVCDENGVGISGVLIRHLVLPNRSAGSIETLQWIADLSTDIPLSLMSQYSPHHRANRYPELSRGITREEYREVLDCAENLGFTTCFVQQMESVETYVPDFNKEEPFGPRIPSANLA